MIDVTPLLNKVENGGTTAFGRASAAEWNLAIQAIQECQGAVKAIRYNGGVATYPDENGIVDLVVTENNFVLNVTPTIVGMEPPYKIALGSSFVMRLGIAHKFIVGEDRVPAGAVDVTYYVNDSEVGTASGTDGSTIDFDFKNFLQEGTNSVYAVVNNNNGNIYSNRGVYSVEAISLGVSLPTFDPTDIQSGDWSLQVAVSGSRANVYVQIDDTAPASPTGDQNAGSTANYTITSGHSMGVHRLKVWAEYYDDPSIKTEAIEHEYIYNTGTSTTPVIATSFDSGSSVDMYNVLNVPYWIFDPNYADDPEIVETVTLSLLTDTKQTIVSSERTVELNLGSTGMLTYSLPLFDDRYIGERYIRIQYGSAEPRDIGVLINKGSVTLNDVSGYDLYLSAAGRSNSDTDYNVWSYGNYNVTFPDDFDFDENGSGWNADSDGNIALHIRKGHFVTLNYQPFAVNPAFGNGEDVPGTKTGLTFSIELATRNCTAKDGSVVRCMYNGVGFEFFANSMRFASNSESLSADYKEDTRVRIDIVIEGTEKPYSYTDSDGVVHNENEALMWVYLDGVYQQLKQISEVSNFKQDVAQNITIGSDSCDVDVYCIRVYRNDLNFKGITDNYAYDTPKTEDKIAIAKRNNVFTSQLEVSYAMLREARPDLGIMVISNDEIPSSKTWITASSIAFQNPANADNPNLGGASFTTNWARWRNQGTSSMNYPVPFRNYDISFLTDASGANALKIGETYYAKYRLYDNEDAAKSFTLKKNYASSEMCNNAVLSMFFTEMATGIGTTYDTLTLAQKAYGSYKYRQSLYALPIYLFVYRGGNYEPIGQYDFVNYKTDEKHLGFVSPYTWGESRAQCWEIRDNNVFWDMTYSAPYVAGDGSIVNDVFRYYEARYPKDSPTLSTSSASVDFGNCRNASEIANATDETADILRLHNWLCSVNQRTATNQLLSEPYTDKNGTVHRYDNATYRLQKFLTEADNYLIVDSFILYYIWREVFWMIDSGSKNFNLYTMDGVHWGAMARDCDTGLGINNSGALTFPYYIEDYDYMIGNDFVTPALINRRGTVTGQITDIPANAGEVLNGQYGSLWINIRDGFGDRIQNMFSTLYNNAGTTKFSYAKAIEWFENYQGAWSESLFNYSAKQYHGGAPYTKWIESGLGDKKNQRRNWLYYGFRYRASKYHANSATNRISWRPHGNGCDLNIIPYSEMYVCLGFGSYDYSTTTRYRCTDLANGVTVRNEWTSYAEDNVMYLFDADMLVDIGDLYKFGNTADLNLSYATRLRSLRLGSKDDKVERQYVNTRQFSLDLTSCRALEELDITNCEGFGQGTGQNGIYTLNLSNQKGLKALYAYGSSVTGVTFPRTPTLETVELGDRLSQLRLIGLTGLKNFSIQDESKLTTINITDTPVVDSFSVVNSAVNVSAPLTSVIVNNVNWPSASASLIGTLVDMPTADLSGSINIEGANTAVSFDMKRKFISKWGAVDSADNSLHITYPQYNIVNALINGDDGVAAVGDYQYSVTPATAGGVAIDYGNDFKDVNWYVSSNIYCSVDRKTGLVSVYQVGTETESGGGPTVTLTCQLTKLDNTIVSATKTVRMYQRSAYVGDYVFADGSYSDQYDGTKSVIGICFYVNGTNRLMVATKNVSVGTARWGLYNNEGDSYSIPGLVDDLNTSYSWYNTPIADRTSSGIVATSEGGTGDYISDATYRDATAEDGFRVLGTSTVCATLGLTQLTADLGGYASRGDYMNWGQMYTLQLIIHRDRILSQLNAEIPTASVNESETEALTRCRLEMQSTAQEEGITNYVQYDQFYYPAASYCYAYEPTVTTKETLADRFKAHNWWLPSAGELARLYWYHSKGYDGGEYAIFSDGVANNTFTRFTASYYWSSSESSQYFAWSVYFTSGFVYRTGIKCSAYYVRAVSAF